MDFLLCKRYGIIRYVLSTVQVQGEVKRHQHRSDNDTPDAPLQSSIVPNKILSAEEWLLEKGSEFSNSDRWWRVFPFTPAILFQVIKPNNQNKQLFFLIHLQIVVSYSYICTKEMGRQRASNQRRLHCAVLSNWIRVSNFASGAGWAGIGQRAHGSRQQGFERTGNSPLRFVSAII